MITKRDFEILQRLRKNARQKITTIAEETNIPVTTIYDKVRAHDKKYVRKHTALLDFEKLGFLTTVHIAIRTTSQSRDAVQQYLMQHPNINTLYRTNFSSDFIAEGVFRNHADLHSFTDEFHRQFNPDDLRVHTVISELKKEEMLSKPEHFALFG